MAISGFPTPGTNQTSIKAQGEASMNNEDMYPSNLRGGTLPYFSPKKTEIYQRHLFPFHFQSDPDIFLYPNDLPNSKFHTTSGNQRLPNCPLSNKKALGTSMSPGPGKPQKKQTTQLTIKKKRTAQFVGLVHCSPILRWDLVHQTKVWSLWSNPRNPHHCTIGSAVP